MTGHTAVAALFPLGAGATLTGTGTHLGECAIRADTGGGKVSTAGPGRRHAVLGERLRAVFLS